MAPSDTTPPVRPTRVPGPMVIAAATGLGVFLSALDSSIVNVSLVTVARDLAVGREEIQWVVVAYLLVYTAFMPLMGKVGDRLGLERVFQSGMVLFMAGSLMCALSHSLVQLVVARLFQALGASMMAANGLALIAYFTTPEDRGRAMGLNSVVLAAALAMGPVIGGVLSEHFGWPSIFLVNLPVGLVGLVFFHYEVGATERDEEVAFDVPGALLLLGGLAVTVLTVSLARRLTPDYTLPLVALATLFFVGFVLREEAFHTPMIPVALMADRRIATSVLSALLMFIAIVPVTYMFPFFLQEALGYDQSMTGLLLVVHPLVISIVGPAAGLMSERVSGAAQTSAGLVLVAAGLFAMGAATPHVPSMLAAVAVMGVGTATFSVANGNFAMTAAPPQHRGVVSALVNVARTTGFAIGTAGVTAVFVVVYGVLTGIPGGPPTIDVTAYILTYRAVVWTFSLFAVAGAVVSLVRGPVNRTGTDAVGEQATAHARDTEHPGTGLSGQ